MTSDGPAGPAICVLGPLSLQAGGESIAVGGPLPRRLLSALLVSRDGVVSRDRLVEVLWGDDPPDAALSSLHASVSRLRRLLPAAARLETVAPGYRLGVEAGALDVDRFEEALDDALNRAGRDPQGALAGLEGALACWKGDAYAEFADQWWARGEAARLEERRLHALEARAEVLLALGRDEAAVGEARAVTAKHPSRERAWRILVLALHRGGRQSEALRAAHGYRARLRDESGLDPSAEFAALERDIAVDAPQLRTPAPSAGPIAAAGTGEVARSPSPGADSAGDATRTLADTVPGNLPTMVTSLVGRDAEIGAVSRLLGAHRLVTVVGAGGLGKTRVAVHAGTEATGRFGDGVWFVDLLAIGPGQVAAAIASALSIQLPVTGPAEQALVGAMSGQRLLLVLDNCEHVLSEAAHIASTLVTGSAGVAVLATSRQPLCVAGEQLFPLPPLGDEAVPLFVERARLVSPAFEPTAEEVGKITGLCDRLDGLPLAIELAAGRMRSHTVDELVDGLGDRFNMLRAVRSDGGDRHESMTRTLDWSYDLLVPEEQVVFDRCSVFAGTFTRRAAAEICCGDDFSSPQVTDIVESLIDKSLIRVRTSGAPSSRLDLLDTMRAYGQARLALRGEQSATTGAHARWYAEHSYQIGTALFGAGEADRMTTLVESVDNCRAAFRYLAEHDRAGAERLCGGFALAGWLLLYEPFDWAISLWSPDHAADLSDGHLWYCATMAWAAMSLGRPDLLAEVRAHLDGLGADPTHPAMLEAEFAQWGARGYRAGGYSDADLDHDAERLRANARATGSGYLMAMALMETAGLLRSDEALDQLEEGARLAERDEAFASAAVSLVLGSTLCESTDPERAANDLTRGLDLAARTNSPFVDNGATGVQLNSKLSRLDPEAKRAAADRLLVSWHRAGDVPRVFTTLSTITTLLDERGEPIDIVFLDEAIRCHNARHTDGRVRRQQAAAAQNATAHLGPTAAEAERRKAQHASIGEIVIRARQALAAEGPNIGHRRHLGRRGVGEVQAAGEWAAEPKVVSDARTRLPDGR